MLRQRYIFFVISLGYGAMHRFRALTSYQCHLLGNLLIIYRPHKGGASRKFGAPLPTVACGKINILRRTSPPQATSSGNVRTFWVPLSTILKTFLTFTDRVVRCLPTEWYDAYRHDTTFFAAERRNEVRLLGFILSAHSWTFSKCARRPFLRLYQTNAAA